MISLVGMPGGGKSTVGRHLARRLGVPFFDSDAEIERQLQCSIRDYFETSGEASFRAIESATLSRLIGAKQGVLATGGGAVLNAANRDALRLGTVCVYLRSTPEELFKRLRHDAKRPLLQVADPLARLRDLYAVRDPLYRGVAHFVIELRRPSLTGLINMIAMQLELSGAVEAVAQRPSGHGHGVAPQQRDGHLNSADEQ